MVKTKLWLKTLLFVILVVFIPACSSTNETSRHEITESQEDWESPFGIFGAYAIEYQCFQNRMGFNNDAYWGWVDGHFSELGAHWTRSNLQLIWDQTVVQSAFYPSPSMPSDFQISSDPPTRVDAGRCNSSPK